MIIFTILLFILLTILAVMFTITGGVVVLLLDPIICIVLIYLIYKLVNMFKKKDK